MLSFYTDAGQPLIFDLKDDMDKFADNSDAQFDSINNFPCEPINYVDLLETCYTNKIDSMDWFEASTWGKILWRSWQSSRGGKTRVYTSESFY